MTAPLVWRQRILIVLAIGAACGFAAWVTSLLHLREGAGTLHERPLLLTTFAFVIGLLAGVTWFVGTTPLPFWRRALPLFWFCLLIGLNRIELARWPFHAGLEIFAAATTAALLTWVAEFAFRWLRPRPPAPTGPE